MGIEPKYNKEEIEAEFNRKLIATDSQIILAFQRAGEDFFTDATLQPGGADAHSLGFYQDRTTALRKSIGYYIFRDGELLFFKEDSLPPEAKAEVQALVIKKGYQLIGVAGMGYASYVEAKGYNVISNQAEAAIINLREYISDLAVFAQKEGE